MQINQEFLKNLKPCTSRYKNYLEYNSDFDGSFSEFLNLDTISYDDKVWVAVRVLNQTQRVKWSILCAESVVHIFKNQYPDDKSISNCINFLKTVKDFDNLTDAERLEIEGYASHATYAGDNALTVDAAIAADAVVYAAYSAIYASVSYVSESASCAVHAAAKAGGAVDEDAAKHNQRELNIQFLNQIICP